MITYEEGDWFDDEAIQSERFEADIEQAELERDGRVHAKLAGIPGKCLHGWSGPDESAEDWKTWVAAGRPGSFQGALKCYYNCGKTWPNAQARESEGQS